MAANLVNGHPEHLHLNQATYYKVLGVDPALIDSQDDPSILIKQAYRRALLRHHPDKVTAKNKEEAADPKHIRTAIPSSSSSSSSPTFSIDQISQAFAVLSSPRRRSEYDANLRLSRAAGNETDLSARFQTGVENVDLDDLDYDDGEGRWHRSCRCGNDSGFSFQEDDLIEVEHEGALLVGCQDCSLWLKVHFAVVEDNGDEDEDKFTHADRDKERLSDSK